ncbi:MAG: hypothetical protein QF921_00245 [Pseudomonadales bacterium]|jgi:hypothetical protein|nr:hypothetical protein [Pseudomonadales bacterium]MDP6472034.1 hypothetical protein [Pseudomonadales bacterium]MDP6826693.1 hypothetical protein [Pseudomonadales bacterium]MDP6969946.1 hypothetical protein [Pseudomonadales bacterium]|tara:strand:- start:6277 stop:6687 length:411 start_codon:yes stop_codon:yes gene_type:complete
MLSKIPILIATMLLASCGGPLAIFPGGKLQGEVVHTRIEDWSFTDTPYLELETRPSDPYSVQINYAVRDKMLYIDPAEGRRWFQHLKKDLRVRVRFGERIYPVTAVLVGRPGELPGFDPERYIYRLDSRDPESPRS